MNDNVQLHTPIAEWGSLKIRALIEKYPASKSVLFKHTGAACFGCPAADEESVELGIRVHGAVADDFYQDLAEVLSSQQSEHPEE